MAVDQLLDDAFADVDLPLPLAVLILVLIKVEVGFKCMLPSDPVIGLLKLLLLSYLIPFNRFNRHNWLQRGYSSPLVRLYLVFLHC